MSFFDGIEPRRERMTEDEHIQLVDVGNEFWEEFSKLCAKYIQKMPPHLVATTTEYLQDKTSIYGSKYDDYLSPEYK